MARYPVFIVGSPRSGTSALVDAMLAAGYSGFREGMFLSLLSGLNELVSQHFATFGTDASEEVLISRIAPEPLKAELFSVIKRYADAAEPPAPWFDKTGNPDMIRAVPIIKRLWPDGVFIFSKRRGIENVLSRLSKFPAYDFEYHCRDWATNMGAWREVRQLLPAGSFVEVDQRDMIQNPARVAAKLQAFLGLAPNMAIEETLASSRPQQTGPGSAQRILTLDAVGWSTYEMKLFVTHCASEMEAYGYTYDIRYRDESLAASHA